MANRNWEALGIQWNSEPVSKQHGDHATDRKVVGNAEIPVVTDLEKFTAEFGESCILGILDGTSVRVMAQDVNRRLLAAGKKGEEIREAIYNRLRGVRNAGTRAVVVKEVKVYNLPDGSEYKGTDLVEYQQAYAAALVAEGFPTDKALALAKKQSL